MTETTPLSNPERPRIGRPPSETAKSGPGYKLATWLRENMNRMRITQSELAEEMGYERQQMISMMKRGKARVPLKAIPMLAKHLEVDETFLTLLALEQYYPGNESKLFGLIGRVVSESFFDFCQQFENVIPPEKRVYSSTQKKMTKEILSSPAVAEKISKAWLALQKAERLAREAKAK